MTIKIILDIVTDQDISVFRYTHLNPTNVFKKYEAFGG